MENEKSVILNPESGTGNENWNKKGNKIGRGQIKMQLVVFEGVTDNNCPSKIRLDMLYCPAL